MSADEPPQPQTERVRVPGPLDDQRGRLLFGALATVAAVALAIVLYASSLPLPVVAPSPLATELQTTSPTTTPARSAPGTTAPSSIPTPSGSQAQTAHSDDGTVTVFAVPGAMPAGTQLVVTQYSAEDDPPELDDVTRLTGHYEIVPNGLSFASPLQVTWHVPLSELGRREDTPGLPVLAMAVRGAHGWQWLGEQSYDFAPNEAPLRGYLPESGAIFVLIARMYIDARVMPGVDRTLGQKTRIRFAWSALDVSASPPRFSGAGISITGYSVIETGERELKGGYQFTLHCRAAPGDGLVSAHATIAQPPFDIPPAGTSSPAGTPSLNGLASGPGELTFTMTRDVLCAAPPLDGAGATANGRVGRPARGAGRFSRWPR
jgi:hypothetical protein